MTQMIDYPTEDKSILTMVFYPSIIMVTHIIFQYEDAFYLIEMMGAEED